MERVFSTLFCVSLFLVVVSAYSHSKNQHKQIHTAVTTSKPIPPTTTNPRKHVKIFPTTNATPSKQAENSSALPLIVHGTFIIDVPLNCESGKAVDHNGNCRPIWGRRKRSPIVLPEKAIVPAKQETKPKAVVAPECIIACDIPECPPGQKLDPNGDCRNDWDG